MTWRRKCQTTLVLLPGKFLGYGSLVGYSPWGHKESDTIKQLTHTHTQTQDGGIEFALLMMLIIVADLSLWSGEVKWKLLVMSHSLRSRGLYIPWNSPGQNTGVGGLSFLQGIFSTQVSNPGLPHYRWILYQLNHIPVKLLLLLTVCVTTIY